MVQHFRLEAFKGISYQRIKNLADVLKCSSLKRYHLIRRRYRERATGFEEQLRFLNNLGVISVDNEIIHVLNDELIQSLANNHQKKWLFDYLMRGKNRYKSELLEFWRYIDKPTFTFQQSKWPVSHTSEIRDFLIDIDVLLPISAPGNYALDPLILEFYIDRKYRQKYELSPESLNLKLEKKGEIGIAAEKRVMEYEQARLGLPTFEMHVKHVAKFDTSLGFDIKSITVGESFSIPRFIEVKAVSNNSLRFFLSPGECGAAKHYGSLYYLYLLPVKNNTPQLDLLQIIQDPYHIFFEQKDTAWQIKPDGYCIESLNYSKGRLRMSPVDQSGNC